jgi:hypothetical protein
MGETAGMDANESESFGNRRREKGNVKDGVDGAVLKVGIMKEMEVFDPLLLKEWTWPWLCCWGFRSS